ncbi:MMPL family transporter [Actinomadura macrotermitis]|uniref:Membrane protein YdfJ n=1 Tax=Actinomadura macrotermitis TaxID=2585200 RepID=A0A7K0BYR1_9ACTN|nr:MMPL family transporter [Actinomadura macrotermitis]MQY06319.1 Membrane protein YdfJ [Actinomadura macrotermitis]
MTDTSVSRIPDSPHPPPAPPPSRWNGYVAAVTGRRSKWAVLAAWLLIVLIAGGFAAKVADVQDNDPASWLPADSQATRAVEIAERHFAEHDRATAVVVYTRDGGLTPADLAKADRDRGATPGATAPTRSADGRSVLFSAPVPMASNDNGVLGDAVGRLRKTTGQAAPAGLDVRVTGQAGTIADYIEVYSGMDGVLLAVALAVVTVVLLVTYRSPVLWSIPLLATFLGTWTALGAVYLLARHAGLKVDGQSSYILMVLGLGVGTDYALLLIARYREELGRRADRHEAMAHALRRCLPAVTASAATVVIASLCLVFGRMNNTQGLGPVVAIGVAVVCLAATSLLPALLVVLGRWVFWPRRPAVAPAGPDAPAAAPGTGLWGRVAAAVDARPRLIWIGSAAALAVLAAAAFTLHSGQALDEQFTGTTDAIAGQRQIARHFPAGSAEPADVYVADARAGAVLARVGRVGGVTSAARDRSAGGYTHLTVVLADEPDTPAARATITRVRDAVAGTGAVVGGQTAVALDTSRAQGAEEALLIPLILAVVLIMLVLLLRALTASLLLIASVVLSYGAALGMAGLLYRALGHPRIDRGLLLFGFLFLVALGIDYTIFLMSRAREEAHLHGHRAGVLNGLRVTGGVITSAGLVLAATFGVMAVVPTVSALQQGLLIAGGVLLDTLVVRSLLIPALALDAGKRIWWPARVDD